MRKNKYRFYNFFKENADPVDKIDDELFRKLEGRLAKAKFTLYKTWPFFGLILTQMKTVITREVPTMAVDNNRNIYINPEFATETLSLEETIGVLAHEAFHIANLTFFRQKGRIHKLWNVATDYIMNRDLIEANLKLPSLGLIPERRGDKWIAVISDGGQIKHDIDITDMTSEQLYDAILNFAKTQQPQGPTQPPPPGPPNPLKNGDPIYIPDTGEYGEITNIDTGEYKPITAQEAEQIAISNQGAI